MNPKYRGREDPDEAVLGAASAAAYVGPLGGARAVGAGAAAWAASRTLERKLRLVPRAVMAGLGTAIAWAASGCWPAAMALRASSVSRLARILSSAPVSLIVARQIAAIVASLAAGSSGK